VHNLIRDEGLVSAHERVSRARAAALEMGQAGMSSFRDDKRYGVATALCVVLTIAFSVAFLVMAVYSAWHRELPRDLVDGIAVLQNYTQLLHAKHAPIELELIHADEPHEAPGPYASLTARTGIGTDAPSIIREPCRRLSRAELTAGITTEGYVLPLLLMRMCEIVHELYGCDEDGVLVPKHIETPDALNICVITFKEASGVCHHYVNPVVRPVKSTMRNDITITSPHFAALGEHVLTVHPQVLVSFQPILATQVDADQASPDAPVTRALSDAYKALPLPDAGQWLPSIPEPQTLTIGTPRAYYLFIAYSSLTGEYPFGDLQ